MIDQPVATLRGLNGLYLVSVQRGDMLLRAVTPEFLLEEGDVLHFTGLVESIGEVCVEHGLLPLTHEVEETLEKKKTGAKSDQIRLSLEDDGADRPGSDSVSRGAFSGEATDRVVRSARTRAPSSPRTRGPAPASASARDNSRRRS